MSAVDANYRIVLDTLRCITSERLYKASNVLEMVHERTQIDRDYILSVMLRLVGAGFFHQPPGGRLFWAVRD